MENIEKKIYEVFISENPKTGFRLFKRIKATKKIAENYKRKLQKAFYVFLKEVEIINK